MCLYNTLHYLLSNFYLDLYFYFEQWSPIWCHFGYLITDFRNGNLNETTFSITCHHDYVIRVQLEKDKNIWKFHSLKNFTFL